MRRRRRKRRSPEENKCWDPQGCRKSVTPMRSKGPSPGRSSPHLRRVRGTKAEGRLEKEAEGCRRWYHRIRCRATSHPQTAAAAAAAPGCRTPASGCCTRCQGLGTRWWLEAGGPATRSCWLQLGGLREEEPHGHFGKWTREAPVVPRKPGVSAH